MKTSDRNCRSLFIASSVCWALAIFSIPVFGQFKYAVDQSEVTITGYTGGPGAVNIPSTIDGLPVSKIENGLFYGNREVTSVRIPATVRVIGRAALAFCENLVQIEVDPESSYFRSRDGVLFDWAQVTLLQFPSAGHGAYVVPVGIKEIGSLAFFSSKVTSIHLPSSLEIIGEGAFGLCSGLTQVTVPFGVKRIENVAFLLCNNLSDIVLPSGLSHLGISSFAYTSLSRLEIPAGLTTIETLSFNFCEKLVTVVIPNSVTAIEGNAFAGCTALKDVYFKGNCPAINETSFSNTGTAIFYYFPGTTGWVPTVAGHSTRLWNASMKISSFADNQVNLVVNGTSGLKVVIETTSNIGKGPWVPIVTNTIIEGTTVYESQRPNGDGQIYRLRSP